MVEEVKKQYLVYAHYLLEELIYIGCGTKTRPFTTKKRNFLWKDKVGSSKFRVEIFGEFDCKKKALEEEIRLIQQHQPPCNRTGVNRQLTDKEKLLRKLERKQNKYDRIVSDIGTEQKLKLIKHTKETGQGVSFVVRKLIDLFLAGRVNLD